MPDQLAKDLLEIEPRLSDQTHSDPWALSWMLAVGATYSLARAKELLPGAPADFRTDAIALLKSVSQASARDAASATWSLGYYLNSTEARIQAAVHRVLRAYTGRDEYALVLVDHLDKSPADQRPSDDAMQILTEFRDAVRARIPGNPLSNVWVRGNSVKHDPAQDVSDQFNFSGRWSDARASIAQLVSLINILGPR